MRGIAVNDDQDLIVAVGVAGVGYTSTDGTTWSVQDLDSGESFNDVTWSELLGLWIAVGDVAGVGDSVVTSPDGVTWTQRTEADSIDWWGVEAGNVLSASDISSFDTDTGTKRDMTWKSGILKAPYPMNLGAARIVAESYPVTLNVWNDQGDLVVTDRSVTSSEVIRLPGGYVSNWFEIQVEGDDAIDMVHLGETIQDLREG
jgi:hypothetical protein